jgi:hypothetical protein
VRFVLSYLLLDFITNQTVPDIEHFAFGKERLLHRIAAGDLSLADGLEVAGTVLGYSFAAYFAESMMYDFFSVLAVGLGISQVADWPPLFGSIFEAYSVRRFWASVTFLSIRSSISVYA